MNKLINKLAKTYYNYLLKKTETHGYIFLLNHRLRVLMLVHKTGEY